MLARKVQNKLGDKAAISSVQVTHVEHQTAVTNAMLVTVASKLKKPEDGYKSLVLGNFLKTMTEPLHQGAVKQLA